MSLIFNPFSFNTPQVTAAGLHPSASNFITATGITDEGLKTAINNLTLDLINEGLWTKMSFVYPFVTDKTTNADILDQFKFNLITTASFTLTFTNGTSQTQSKDGFQTAAATSTNADTGWNPITVLGSGTAPMHMSIQSKTTQTADNFDMAGFSGGGNNTGIKISFSTGGTSCNWSPRAGVGVGNATDGGAGYFIGTVDNAISPRIRFAKNGTVILSTDSSGTNMANTTIKIGGGWSPSLISTKRYSFSSGGSGLTNTEMSKLNTLVVAFQSAVDAAVGSTRSL